MAKDVLELMYTLLFGAEGGGGGNNIDFFFTRLCKLTTAN
jgi:hypothetical protein